ncbi:MAG: two-component regulator propeller domain-containing protein [Cyclobacteriaceae bacterium]
MILRKSWMLVCLLLSFQLLAQPSHYRFHRYDNREGLASSTVNALAEDSYGFIWIGTADGLCRFDGYSFKVFRKSDNAETGLNSNWITALLALENGDLWVGTEEGLLYFDSRSEKFTQVHKELNIEPTYISKILPDGAGNLWVGTKSGLYFVSADKKVTSYKPVKGDPTSLSQENIFDLLLDSQNRLWVSTSRGGLDMMLPDKKSFRVFRNDPKDPASISSDFLRKMILMPDGKILVGTSDRGFNVLDPATFTFTNFNHDPANVHSLSSTSAFSFLLDSQKHLWVGTWSSGLNLFDLSTGRATRFMNNPDDPYSIPNNAIRCMLQTSTGDIFIGTDNGGVARFNARDQQMVRYQHNTRDENSLFTNLIKSVYEDEDRVLWIGTTHGGLNKYDPRTEQFSVYIKPDNTQDGRARGTIWSISPGENNILWLGTSRGVGKFNKLTGVCTFYEPDDRKPEGISANNILKVHDDGQGSVWIGTWYGGLNRLDIKSGKFEHFFGSETDSTALPSNNITDIHQDKRGRIWVATEGSLSLFDARKRNFSHIPLGKASVLMITEDEKGTLWLASSEGLIKYDPETHQKEIIQEKNGLSGNLLNTVLVDLEGWIWIGSNKAIDRYNPVTKKIFRYDVTDGLAGNDTESRACFRSKSGKLFFGGSEGLTAIDPQKLTSNNLKPKIQLTNLLLFNKSVSVSDTTVLTQTLHTARKLSLDYSNYIFAIEFSALNFDQADRNQYSYKLEGFDKDWVTTGYADRKAVYTNVPPGDYTFRVKASNNAGVWNEEGIELKITIIPPWWKTWWAQAIFYMALAGCVFLFFQVRVSVIKHQKRLLEEQVRVRTAEVVQQKEEIQSQAERLQELNTTKDKLFSIIAHDLRGPLNSLQGIMSLLDPKILTSEDLAGMKSNLSSRIESIAGVMDNLLQWAKSQMKGERVKPELVKLELVMQEMMKLFTPLAESKNVTLSNAVHAGLQVFADINQLRAILRNLISNAIKFTPEGGRVEVAASGNQQTVTLSVSDTGVGISPEQAAGLFSITTNVSTRGTAGETGVGLGLLLVKEFVEKNKGRVWVEPNTGAGTTFHVTLPARQ